jgi:hypothetical protein
MNKIEHELGENNQKLLESKIKLGQELKDYQKDLEKRNENELIASESNLNKETKLKNMD